MQFNVLKRDEETGENEIVDTIIYPGKYWISKVGEVLCFSASFGDIIEEEGYSYYENNWGFEAVKYKQVPVDFTGTWKLSEKIYESDEFQGNLVILTINNDGSWSLKIDGTEKNTEDYTIDLDSSNGDNLLKCYRLTGIITETNKLLL